MKIGSGGNQVLACYDVEGNRKWMKILEKREGGEITEFVVPEQEKTNDPVRMYLREMGTVKLLDREGEVEIAQRIEAGEAKVFIALSKEPDILRLFLRTNEQARRERRGVRELTSAWIHEQWKEHRSFLEIRGFRELALRYRVMEGELPATRKTAASSCAVRPAEPADLEELVLGACRCFAPEHHAAEKDLDPGQQLPHRKRFAQVVVGADLQPDDPVGLLAACSEHQHWHG